MNRNSRTSWASLLLLSVLLLACCSLATAKDRIVVESLADLPVFSYPTDSAPSAMLKDDAVFDAFTEALWAHLNTVFEDYQISDPSTLQDMIGVRNALHYLADEYDQVLAGVEEMRALESKEATRLTMGLTTASWIAARREAGEDEAALCAAYERNLAARLSELPWEKIQDIIQSTKGRAEIMSESLLLGIVQAQVDPVVAKTGELGFDLSRQLVNMRLALKVSIPCREGLIAAYGAEIDRHAIAKENIWLTRDVALEDGPGLAPVVIGIWDSGVDMEVYGDAAFVNPGETLDGTDSDGNGFVDDVHGIAFDLDARAVPELLHPLGEAAGRMDQIMDHTKGFMDVQASIDSKEASALRAHMGGLAPEEVNGFLEDLNLCGLYAHGTHVAGIALAGNPAASVLGARITFDYHSAPQAVTLELAKSHAESYHRAVAYFATHGVRVVNMSWGWSLKEIESTLEANAVGADAAERLEMAGVVLDVLSEGLHTSIASQPDILFVVAAGNDDNDVNFDRVIPSNFELPNVMVVGAVDQAGEPTDFTSSGSNVVVYSNGFEVESYVPGGRRMEFSGTSMAAPNVCNLAGKLLALSPELTPGQLIELIEQGADTKEAHQAFKLLNPKATLALVRD